MHLKIIMKESKMKKIWAITAALVAMITLNGCNPGTFTPPTADNDKVDIYDLARKGYAIYATNAKGQDVVIDFCTDRHYFYSRNGRQVEDGDYYIEGNGIVIAMVATSNNGSETINTYNGYLRKGETYYVKGVESITIYDISNAPSCDY
jgi:hypothetical protein